jgi:serine/threonine protein kinase
VKIFDFGLAKEFDPKSAVDGAYKLTGDTGSPRYMAPGKSWATVTTEKSCHG